MSERNPDNLVAHKDGCPLCEERETDRPFWLDDERVQCQNCETVYRPPQPPPGDPGR